MTETPRKVPFGLDSEVARATGFTRAYVAAVLSGRLPNTSLNAKRIEKKAAEILAELNKPA